MLMSWILTYANPDNIVPIGADPMLTAVAELCAAIVAAAATA